MLYIKTAPVGVDTHIDGLQKLLYTPLVAAWQLDANSNKDYNSYARAYRNQANDGHVPEVYVGSKEYKEVMIDDKVKALSFFVLGESVPFNTGQYQAPIALIFCVQLNKLKNGTTREDEEVRSDVIRLVQNNLKWGFRFTGYETGIENVFKEFDGLRRNTGMKFRDMQPFHVFRLNFELTYKNIC